MHPTDANQLLAGSQDNGTQLRTDSPTFDVTLGGDGMWDAYKRSDPNIALGQTQQAAVRRSTDGGRTWTRVLDASGDHQGLWCAPLVNDTRTPSRFYLGTNFLYRSTNDGQTWSRISGDLTDGGVLNVIAVAPSDSNVIYTGVYRRRGVCQHKRRSHMDEAHGWAASASSRWLDSRPQ